jgi:hypothetical protein
VTNATYIAMHLVGILKEKFNSDCTAYVNLKFSVIMCSSVLVFSHAY